MWGLLAIVKQIQIVEQMWFCELKSFNGSFLFGLAMPCVKFPKNKKITGTLYLKRRNIPPF